MVQGNPSLPQMSLIILSIRAGSVVGRTNTPLSDKSGNARTNCDPQRIMLISYRWVVLTSAATIKSSPGDGASGRTNVGPNQSGNSKSAPIPLDPYLCAWRPVRSDQVRFWSRQAVTDRSRHRGCCPKTGQWRSSSIFCDLTSPDQLGPAPPHLNLALTLFHVREMYGFIMNSTKLSREFFLLPPAFRGLTRCPDSPIPSLAADSMTSTGLTKRGPCATTNRGALFRLAAHIPAEPFGKNFLSFYHEKYNEAWSQT